MPRTPPARLANALLLPLGWLACLLGGNGLGALVVGLALALHLRHTSSWAAEGKLLVSVFLLGSALDSFLMHLGFFDFGQPRVLIPLWQALPWLLLATTLDHALAWTAQPGWRASLIGALGGPLIYYAGARLAAVELPHGTLSTLLVLAVLWAILLPLLHGFARLYRLQHQQALRRAGQPPTGGQ